MAADHICAAHKQIEVRASFNHATFPVDRIDGLLGELAALLGFFTRVSLLPACLGRYAGADA
jgi:hypothetical protein